MTIAIQGFLTKQAPSWLKKQEAISEDPERVQILDAEGNERNERLISVGAFVGWIDARHVMRGGETTKADRPDEACACAICGAQVKHGEDIVIDEVGAVENIAHVSCLGARDGFEIVELTSRKVIDFVECSYNGSKRERVERGMLMKVDDERFFVRDTRDGRK